MIYGVSFDADARDGTSVVHIFSLPGRAAVASCRRSYTNAPKSGQSLLV